MTTAQDGGKVVSLMHRPPLPPGIAPGTHFWLRLSRPQGHSAIRRNLCQWKIPMTPAGIEAATFRFVSQHLNHCAIAVPLQNNPNEIKIPFRRKLYKSRLMLGNVSYHSMLNLLSSNLLSKNIEIKIYRTTIFCWFVWVWNLVAHIEGRKWAEGVWE